jgi:uncharacterized membrane protein YfhO
MKLDYFYTTRNYVDIARLSLGYIWGFYSMHIGFDNLNQTDILTLLTSLLFWMEGLQAFKIFDNTRYYIWLI